MPTIETYRAETRTAPIAAPPAAVLAVIGDPMRLPEWAPKFATAIRPDGDHWIVDSGGTDLPIDCRVREDVGTVDLVRPGGSTVGARLRALPSGDGTELLFTIVFPLGVDDAAVAAQMAVVEEELQTIRGLAGG